MQHHAANVRPVRPQPEIPGQDGRVATLADGTRARLRRLEPSDDALFPDFDRCVTDEDRRLRFLTSLDQIPAAVIWTLTHFDRSTAGAVIAVDVADGRMMGVARIHATRDGDGEFAVMVRSDLKGRGLGHELMEDVLASSRRLGLTTVHGLVHRHNHCMISFVRDLGCTLSAVPDEPTLVRARLFLKPTLVG